MRGVVRSYRGPIGTSERTRAPFAYLLARLSCVLASSKQQAAPTPHHHKHARAHRTLTLLMPQEHLTANATARHPAKSTGRRTRNHKVPVAYLPFNRIAAAETRGLHDAGAAAAHATNAPAFSRRLRGALTRWRRAAPARVAPRFAALARLAPAAVGAPAHAQQAAAASRGGHRRHNAGDATVSGGA